MTPELVTFLAKAGAYFGMFCGILAAYFLVKETGKKQERLEQDEATIKDVAKAQQVDNAVSSADDMRVIDELRRDWTK